jgi:hypothetical protein
MFDRYSGCTVGESVKKFRCEPGRFRSEKNMIASPILHKMIRLSSVATR